MAARTALLSLVALTVASAPAPAAAAASPPSAAAKLARARPLLPPPGASRPAPRRLLDEPIVPSDPLLARQWNLGPAGIDAFPLPLPLPTLIAARPVTVAVVDGGVDDEVPDLQGAVAGRRSFAGPLGEASLHGTFVAGLVAARDDGAGLASVGGILQPGASGLVQVLDYRVVRRSAAAPGGQIQPRDEAAAIRAAVDAGARVVNLSFGAPRNPRATAARCSADTASCDDYSAVEAAAVRYAVSRGALVVAAIGNSRRPYAEWPSALPHVVAVSALTAGRQRASFSNSDAVLNDLAAPGESIVSTVPRRFAASGLSTDVRGIDFIDAQGEGRGTSFSAPQVSAAAALLFALNPSLTAAQVQAVLAEAARDVAAPGRDAATGAGALDVAAAVGRVAFGAPLPPRDRDEPNDDAGAQARRLRFGHRTSLQATLSAHDDELDVYGVYLRRGQRLTATLVGPRGADLDLLLFRPRTTSVTRLRDAATLASLVTGSVRPGSRESLTIRADRPGVYALAGWAASGAGAYRLSIRR